MAKVFTKIVGLTQLQHVFARNWAETADDCGTSSCRPSPDGFQGVLITYWPIRWMEDSQMGHVLDEHGEPVDPPPDLKIDIGASREGWEGVVTYGFAREKRLGFFWQSGEQMLRALPLPGEEDPRRLQYRLWLDPAGRLGTPGGPPSFMRDLGLNDWEPTDEPVVGQILAQRLADLRAGRATQLASIE